MQIRPRRAVTHTSCKFAVEQKAIFRSEPRKAGRKVQPNQADPLTSLGCFLATCAAQCPPELTRIWSERSPVEGVLRSPMAVLFNIRADFPCFGSKIVDHSRYLPLAL